MKWYRRRKNQNIKDKFLLEGVKNNYFVRAETTMGAQQEYQSEADEKAFNRFDLTWEGKEHSRIFILAMEIEMSIKHSKILEDFEKLLNNKNSEYKVMVCQSTTETKSNTLAKACAKLTTKYKDNGGEYLLSVWAWDLGKFVHYKLQTFKQVTA